MRGSQRHPNADLGRALRDRVRENSIEPDCGQGQRQRREHPQQERRELAARGRFVQNARHRTDLEGWNVRVEAADRLTHRACNRHRVT